MTSDVDINPIKADRVLDISVCAAWTAQLNSALDSPAARIALDMGGVEKIDTACVQTLAVFMLAAEKASKTVAWSAASENFKSAVQALGLATVLGVNYG